MTSAIHPKAEETKETAEDTAGESAGENPVRYLCMKYNRYQEGDAVACRDPDLYCKFRPQCLIHYKDKRRRKRERDGGESEG